MLRDLRINITAVGMSQSHTLLLLILLIFIVKEQRVLYAVESTSQIERLLEMKEVSHVDLYQVVRPLRSEREPSLIQEA